MLNISSKTLKFLGFLTLTTAFVAGCQSSPSGPPRIELCKASAPRLSMELGKAVAKLSVPPEGKVSIAQGEYVYQSSSYYFHDYDKDIMFHLQHKVDEKGVDAFTLLCVGGDGFKSEMPEYSAEVIAGMTVQPDGTALVATKKISIHVTASATGGVVFKAENVEPANKILVSKVYENFAVAEQNIYDFTAGSIEARARLDEQPENKGKAKSSGVERWTNSSLVLKTN